MKNKVIGIVVCIFLIVTAVPAVTSSPHNPASLRVANASIAHGETRGNESPVAEFTWTPQNSSTYHQITFDASASYEPNGTIISYAWDWNNDGAYDETHSTPITTNTWIKAGSYPISLQVTDDNGTTGVITKTVNVSNITISVTISSGLGVTVMFTNKGPVNVTEVPWRLDVKGGIYGHINATSYGSLALDVGESAPRGTSILLGLGPISITVLVGDQETKHTGIQLIIFTLILP
ncbi:MAG TPA: PKD domain-containing protein [Candidatus Thermoplasmatota archaeon]|nr:PKD domain-containing protein [Candidatus Thermoplasmatota archaeon]